MQVFIKDWKMCECSLYGREVIDKSLVSHVEISICPTEPLDFSFFIPHKDDVSFILGHRVHSIRILHHLVAIRQPSDTAVIFSKENVSTC